MDIPNLKRLLRILLSMFETIATKNLGIYAAGIAYFGVLAFFPLVAAVVAIMSIAIEPHLVAETVQTLAKYLPKDIASMVGAQLQSAAGNHASSVLIAVVGVALSIWAVSGAVHNLILSLNVCYDVQETRHLVKQRLVSIALTAGAIVSGVIVVMVFASTSEVLLFFGVPSEVVNVLSWLRWVLLAVATSFGLAVLYHYGPNHKSRRWQWVSWGAIIATLLWIAASVVFFSFLQYFNNFSNSYSTFAGLIGLMVWLNIGALAVLVGAIINHRLGLRRSTLA